MSEIIGKGLKGSLMGAMFGMLLGTCTSAANMILYEREVPLVYTDRRGRRKQFRNLQLVSDAFLWKPDLVVLAKYQHYNETAFNSAAILTQRLIDLYEAFKDTRKKGGDAVQCIAKYHNCAVKADALWSQLFREIENRRDTIGMVEAQKAAKNLHVAYEHLLGEMRDEFQLDPQISEPTAGTTTSASVAKSTRRK
jgi:hypothetical protein